MMLNPIQIRTSQYDYSLKNTHKTQQGGTNLRPFHAPRQEIAQIMSTQVDKAMGGRFVKHIPTYPKL